MDVSKFTIRDLDDRMMMHWLRRRFARQCKGEQSNLSVDVTETTDVKSENIGVEWDEVLLSYRDILMVIDSIFLRC